MPPKATCKPQNHVTNLTEKESQRQRAGYASFKHDHAPTTGLSTMGRLSWQMGWRFDLERSKSQQRGGDAKEAQL
jgi:hypothetical protein